MKEIARTLKYDKFNNPTLWITVDVYGESVEVQALSLKEAVRDIEKLLRGKP